MEYRCTFGKYVQKISNSGGVQVQVYVDLLLIDIYCRIKPISQYELRFLSEMDFVCPPLIRLSSRQSLRSCGIHLFTLFMMPIFAKWATIMELRIFICIATSCTIQRGSSSRICLKLLFWSKPLLKFYSVTIKLTV